MIVEAKQLGKMLQEKIRPPALLVNTANAAAMLGLSRGKFYQALAGNEIGPRPIMFGSAKRWDVDEFRRWIKAKCPARERWQIMRRSKEPNDEL